MKRIFLNFVDVLSRLFVSVVGIICLGALPGLFDGLSLDFVQYFDTLKDLITKLLNPSTLTYSPDGRVIRAMFPQILIRYKESFIIFISAFFISILLALIIVYYLLHLKERTLNRIKNFFLLLESLPDILIIASMQFLIIWIFKQTDFLVVNVVSAGYEKARGLPIICLSIPSTIMFIKLLLLRSQTEFDKNYILLAKSKGLNRFLVFYRHVLRNVLLSLFYFTKTNI